MWKSASVASYALPPQDGTSNVVSPAQYTQPLNSVPVEGYFLAPESPSGGIVLDDQGNIVEEVQPIIQSDRQAFQVPSNSLPQAAGSNPNVGAINAGAIPSGMAPNFNTESPTLTNPTTGTVVVDNATPSRIGAQSFAMTGRGSSPFEIEVKSDPARGESIIVVTRGVRLSFAGASYQSNGGPTDLGAVSLEADRAVIWTTDVQKLMSGQASEIPIEVYLDGKRGVSTRLAQSLCRPHVLQRAS